MLFSAKAGQRPTAVPHAGVSSGASKPSSTAAAQADEKRLKEAADRKEAAEKAAANALLQRPSSTRQGEMRVIPGEKTKQVNTVSCTVACVVACDVARADVHADALAP